jgi:hypothetical protein
MLPERDALNRYYELRDLYRHSLHGALFQAQVRELMAKAEVTPATDAIRKAFG